MTNSHDARDRVIAIVAEQLSVDTEEIADRMTD